MSPISTDLSGVLQPKLCNQRHQQLAAAATGNCHAVGWPTYVAERRCRFTIHRPHASSTVSRTRASRAVGATTSTVARSSRGPHNKSRLISRWKAANERCRSFRYVTYRGLVPSPEVDHTRRRNSPASVTDAALVAAIPRPIEPIWAATVSPPSLPTDRDVVLTGMVVSYPLGGPSTIHLQAPHTTRTAAEDYNPRRVRLDWWATRSSIELVEIRGTGRKRKPATSWVADCVWSQIASTFF